MVYDTNLATTRSANNFIDNLLAHEQEDNLDEELHLFELLNNIPQWVEHEFDVELKAFQDEILTLNSRKTVMRIARRQGKCLHEDSQILMVTGETKPIKDIRAGDWIVATYKQTPKPRKVKAMMNSGMQECFKVTTRTGRELIATKDHGFLKYVNEARWTKLSQINQGDLIGILCNAPFFGNEVYRDNYVPGQLPDNVYKLNKESSKVVLSDYIFHSAKTAEVKIGARFLFKDQKTADIVNMLLMRFGIFSSRGKTNNKPYLHVRDYYSVKSLIRLFGVPAKLPAGDYANKTNGVMWDEVLSIEPIGLCNTYDIEVDTYKDYDRNFIANGIVVHNSFVLLFKVLHFAITHSRAAIFWMSQSEQNLVESVEVKLGDVLGIAKSKRIEESIVRRVKKPMRIEFGNGSTVRTAIIGKGSSGDESIRGIGARVSGTGRICRATIKKVKDYGLIIGNIIAEDPDRTFKERDIFSDHYIEDITKRKIKIEGCTALNKDGEITLRLSSKGDFIEGRETWIKVDLETGDVLIILDEMDYLSDRALSAVVPILEENPKVEVWAASTPSGERSRFYKWCTAPVDKETGVNTFGFAAFHYPQRLIDIDWILRYPNGDPKRDEFGNIITKEFELKQNLGPLDYMTQIEAEFGMSEGGAYPKHKIDECFRGQESDYLYSNIIDPASPMRTIGVDWNKYSAGPEMVVIQMHPVSKKLYILGRYQLRPADSTSDLLYMESVEMLDYLIQVFQPHHVYVDRGAGEQQVEILLNRSKQPGKDYLKCIKGKDFGSNITIFNYSEGVETKARLKSVMVDNLGRTLENGLLVGRDDGRSINDIIEIAADHYIQPPKQKTIQQVFSSSLPEQLEAMKVIGKDVRGYSFSSGDIPDHAHDALLLAVQAVFENHPDYKDRRPGIHIIMSAVQRNDSVEYKRFSKSLVKEVSGDMDFDEKSKFSIIPMKTISKKDVFRRPFTRTGGSRVYWHNTRDW